MTSSLVQYLLLVKSRKCYSEKKDTKKKKEEVEEK